MNQNNKGSLFPSLCLLGILVQNCYACYNKITNNDEELGLFAKCQNKWCLQKGLQKPQHTKCESVTNKGQTCNNPEIKYGTSTGGLPRHGLLNRWTATYLHFGLINLRLRVKSLLMLQKLTQYL